MLNRRELNPPPLPESADPSFFDYERKFEQVRSVLEDSRKVGFIIFLTILIILMKPVVLLQISRFSNTQSLVFIIIFTCFFGEVFIAPRKLKGKSAFSWFWIPLISVSSSILIGCTGDFITSSIAFAFTIIEVVLVFRLDKASAFTMLHNQEFFTDNLWQDTEKHGNKKDSESYAFFRIEKTNEIVKEKNSEHTYFKRWNFMFIYSLITLIEIIFLHNTSDLLGISGVLLILNVVLTVFLVVQIVKKTFYMTFLFFFGFLVSLNIYQLFTGGLWFLTVIDFAALTFILTLIHQYFRNLYFIRSVNFNHFDLIALLESENQTTAQKCHEILKKNTGFELPLSKDQWLDKFVQSQNAEYKM